MRLPPIFLMAVVTSTVLVVTTSAAEDFLTGICPGTVNCKCKWVTGRRTADCTNAGLKSIPTTLNPNIQVLIMDKNPIRKLEEDVFKMAGLLNLQRVSMRHCDIGFMDENAFRDLKILGDLDMSFNNLTELAPKTFDGNTGLKTIRMSHNHITELTHYQFPPLTSLKTIDFSHCKLHTVDRTAFKNLGKSVESVHLDSNNLREMGDEVLVPLDNLKALTLHSNPWNCDCKLKNFRDWVIHKKLYSKPTSCAEPSRLADKMWDQVLASEFACKPIIKVGASRVFAAPGVDAQLSCYIMGSPVPQARWVVNGRIVNNNTYNTPFAEQTYFLHEQKLTPDGVERWYNLTITKTSDNDLGEYLCVAENNGGVMEKIVTVTFDDPSTFQTPITDEQKTIIIGASVAIVLLFFLLLIVCCCCFCKTKDKSKRRVPNGDRSYAKHNHADNQKLLPNHTNGSVIAVTSGNGSSNPLPKPPRSMGDYQGVPQTDVLNDCGAGMGYVPADRYETEMSDLRAPSVISNTKHSSSSGSDGGRTTSISRASFIGENEPFPDLLDHHRSAAVLNHHLVKPPNSVSPSTTGGSSAGSSNDPSNGGRFHTLNPANLMMTPQQQVQYAHLISPLQRSGTLPLPHHNHSNRSVSCDHTASAIPVTVVPTQHGYHVAPLPVVHHHLHHSQPNGMARPGYVTLPRRPRSSWSVPRETPSPSTSSIHRSDREPIYDGIGPRTSADGSSRLSLNKTPTIAPSPSGSFTQPQRVALPPYYAPIEELQECPPTPKMQQSRMQPSLPKSTPNILNLHNGGKGGLIPLVPIPDSINASSSEATLIEENLSAYCEPFGKAQLPKQKGSLEQLDLSGSKRSSVASSNGDDTKKKRHRSKESLLNDSKPVNGHGPKSSTPLRNGDASLDNSAISAVNGHENRRPNPPPKTLPKPKVKPVPPPKPKKSFQHDGDNSQAPLISFQDEGEDGSEV